MRAIFDKLAALAARCGPVRVYPQKTRAIFQARIRFAGGTPRKRVLIAHFLLPRETSSPRFVDELDGVSVHYKVCYVTLSSVREVDAEIGRWMKRAYRIGTQEHLRQRRRT